MTSNALPDPPVLPASDMRGLPYMPLDVMRLMDSDIFALSSGDEFKAAVALWCKCWLQIPAGSLPDDDRILARLSGAGARWRQVRSMALHGFVKCSDGRLYHQVICEKVRDTWKKRLSLRERSAKGHSARYKNAHGHANGHINGHAQSRVATLLSVSVREEKIRKNPIQERGNIGDSMESTEIGDSVDPGAANA